MKKKSISESVWGGQKLIMPPLPNEIITFLTDQDKHHDATIDIIEACDRWCKKKILSNPNIKPWVKDDKYPFKEYINIEEFLRKHAKEFIRELYGKCPIKGRQIYNIYDSVALVIFKNRLDPWSLISTSNPDNQSIWDKISEEGHV